MASTVAISIDLCIDGLDVSSDVCSDLSCQYLHFISSQTEHYQKVEKGSLPLLVHSLSTAKIPAVPSCDVIGLLMTLGQTVGDLVPAVDLRDVSCSPTSMWLCPGMSSTTYTSYRLNSSLVSLLTLTKPLTGCQTVQIFSSKNGCKKFGQ